MGECLAELCLFGHKAAGVTGQMNQLIPENEWAWETQALAENQLKIVRTNENSAGRPLQSECAKLSDFFMY